MAAISRALVGLGGLLLLATAYLHSTGLEPLEQALSTAALPEFFADAIPVQWLFFSWHLLVLAAVLLTAAAAHPRWYLPAVAFCGLVTLGDFFWVFHVAGWFPGTVVLLGVAALLLVAAVLKARATRVTAT